MCLILCPGTLWVGIVVIPMFKEETGTQIRELPQGHTASSKARISTPASGSCVPAFRPDTFWAASQLSKLALPKSMKWENWHPCLGRGWA